MKLKFISIFVFLGLAFGSVLGLWPVPVLGAEEAAKDSALSEDEIKLTPEEVAEREGRKACKVAICDALHNRKSGDDISCAIVKSFRKSQLDKMLARAKASWPWGRVVCKADIHVKRSLLTEALVADKLDADFGPHGARCTVEREDTDPAVISFDMTPKVTFEKGKAVAASLNWGTVEGPKVIKALMWTATATDNTVNVLGSMVVDDVNSFTGEKCDAVKSDWARN